MTPSDYLVEIGQKELARGRIDDAVHEFKKALLINPQHKQARYELRKLGFVDEGYSGIKSTSERLMEYHNKVVELQKDKMDMEAKLAKMQKEQERLHEIYAVKNLELETLMNRIASIKTLRDKEKQDQLRQIDQVAKFYADQNKDLQQKVADQKKEIVNQQVALLMPNNKTGMNESQLEDKLLNLGYRVNQLDPYTQAKLDVQEKLISLFSEYMDLREQRFLEVENQLAFNEIDKAKQQKQLIKKMNEIIKLQDSVDRYLKRLEDHDQVLTDVNNEKQLLQTELDEMQKKLDQQGQSL